MLARGEQRVDINNLNAEKCGNYVDRSGIEIGKEIGRIANIGTTAVLSYV
jgi:hypothetical protein